MYNFKLIIFPVNSYTKFKDEKKNLKPKIKKNM